MRFVVAHLLLSGAAATAFVRQFSQGWRATASHLLVLAEWDAVLLLVLGLVVAFQPRHRARWACRLLPAATVTCQIYLYALNIVSNMSWGRNITGHLVAAFAPTVWSGKEPFPIGVTGIVCLAVGALAVMTAASRWWGSALEESVRAWLPAPRPGSGGRRRDTPWLTVAGLGLAASALAGTILWGVRTDALLWKNELVVSFFRPNGFAFEPTARRHAMAERDAVLRAAYPRHVTGAPRKHVVLIIVDSLRADHMQVYGYERPTTPFLSGLVESGRMQKVENAFSTCSESFCGITSTLSGREFRDITARNFQLQDVLHDQGYQTRFVLSGNHRVWNGLPLFYHADDGTFFDGAETTRYTMDDDRLVLEGLERVPTASPDRPTFFYLHLMSTHYLGVQFPGSHIFTRPDDEVSPGLEPYKILERLNKPDRYDDKVRQADDIIRQLFDALAAKHYLDDAVVVVTGDHGEGLGERHWAHGWHLYNEDIRIPLLLYDAPAARYTNLAFATQVDIAPTILDRLGLPIPASWEGQSLLAPTAKRFSLHQTYFLPNRFAVLYRADDALFKFIATPQYGKEELYDLTHDLGEGRNLVADQPAVATLLRDKLRTYLIDAP